MAKALKKMEQEAMIRKRPNGSYELTDKGATFTIHARQMVAWIEKNYDLKIINH
jgi:Mn-dependent DtxR family transcriptional regulator